MSITFLFFITILQFCVQYLLYYKPRNWLYEFHSKHLSTLDALPIELFIINIICTLLVCFLTGSGFITGITNLFASAILGLVMKIQMDRYKKSLLDGTFYRKLEEKKKRKAEQKEILQQIRENRKKNWH